MSRNFIRAGAFLMALSVSVMAHAEGFIVTFENLQPAGGFSFTPVWVGLHDGSFDLFDPGSAASALAGGGTNLEDLAEGGAVGGIQGAFTGDQGLLTQPAGFAPIVEPGEIAQTTLTMTAGNGFFSYASMLIPTNDTFIGNGNPMAYAVPTQGNPLTINVGSAWDAGTEVNNTAAVPGGAAFSTAGGTSVDENGTVQLADLAALSTAFNNGGTPAGTITSALAAPLGRIVVTAVPEPSTAGVLALLGCVFAVRRRKRAITVA